MKIKVIKFNDKTKLPDRAHYNDAGADVFMQYDCIIKAHETLAISLGFGLEVPDGYMCCVYPKSGLTKDGLISNLPPIDSGYRGEIHAIITNTTDEEKYITKGQKIGQLVVTPIILADFVEELTNDRGTGAFGSTGK